MSNYTEKSARCVFAAKAHMWHRKHMDPQWTVIWNSETWWSDRNMCNRMLELPFKKFYWLTGNSARLITTSTTGLTAARVHAPSSLNQTCDAFSPTLFNKCWGLGGCWGWPLIVRCSLCGRTPHCTEKRRRKASSNSRSCPSAPGNNRSRGRRPAWPILAWLSVSGGGTSPLSAVLFRAWVGSLLKLWRLLNKGASYV